MQTEEQRAKAIPLVSSSKNILYKYLGEKEVGKFEFVNLKTGQVGMLTDVQSKQLFKVPLELNEVVLKHQNLIQLFERFNGILTIEKDGVKKQYEV